MKYTKARLSLLMFLQFFIWGATGPVISLYLRDCLHFSGTQAGLLLGLSAVGSIFSPVIMTFLADRVISSERLLCLLNVVGGVSMALFSMQTEFYPALFMYILFGVSMSPTVPLISAITFHHAPAEREKFGNIRVWGTVGWIAVAWFFSFVILRDGGTAANAGDSRLPLLLRISAITSFVMAAYSLTVPRGAQQRSPRREFFPADAFRVILKPQVLALSFVGAAGTFIDRFYTIGTAPYLKQIGFSERGIMPAMSLGQIPEIFAMGALAFLLKRFGARAVLLAGVALGAFRFAVCAFGSSRWLIYTALSVHGLVYTFVMITVIICLERHCGPRDRTGVHQLFAVLTGGLGGFLGSYVAGRAADRFTDSAGVTDYSAYWTVPLVLSVIIFVTIFVVRPSNHNV
jgi:nucleoside transporter